MDFDYRYLYGALDGRINRAKWWAGSLLLLVPWVLIEAIFGSFTLGSILVVLATLAVAYPAYALCAKRFQDRNKPGITALYGLGPLIFAMLLQSLGLTGTSTDLNAVGWICALIIWGVGLWFLIDLGLLKGTPGSNPFGGDPLVAVR
jgi:uncharacterized membrane protein YhaH (DUF805 family)